MVAIMREVVPPRNARSPPECGLPIDFPYPPEGLSRAIERETIMGRITAASFLACLAGLVGYGGPAQAGVVVVPSTTKVLQGPAPSGASRIDMTAVRGEWAAFQVVVSTDGAAITGVDATMSDLSGPRQATIPGASFELFREYFVDLTSHQSYCDVIFNPNCADHPEYIRMPGFYPDPLIPFRNPYDEVHGPVGAPFDVTPGSLQVVFADVQVPAGIPAGTYSGTFTITHAGGSLAALPVSLVVYDVDLPATRSISTAFNFSVSELANFHGGADGGDQATRDRIFRNYDLEVHKHRIDFSRTGPRISFQFDADGHLLPPDYTAYDAYWTPRVDGTWYPDGAGVLRWDLGMLKPGSGLSGWTDAQLAEVAQNLGGHLRDKGFLEHVYMYGTDEPWLPNKTGAYAQIAADVVRLHAATDLFNGKVMTTGPWVPELDTSIDIWSPVTAMYGHNFWPEGMWPEPEKYRELRAAGRELWFYVCNANYPPLMGYDVDTPYGHEPRLLKWGAWYEGATGFLYWRMTYWMQPDPWNVLADVPEFGAILARNGDGILVYPGDHNGTLGVEPPPPWAPMDGPLPSLRLKQIRDGLEDWELFRMATDLGGEAFVRRQVERAYRTFGDPLDDGFDPANRPWTLDDGVLIDARQQIALKIQYLQHPDLYPDPETPPLPDVVETADEGPGDVLEPPDVPAVGDVPVEVAADLPADTVDTQPDTAGTSSGGCAASTTCTPSTWILLSLVALALAAARRPRPT